MMLLTLCCTVSLSSILIFSCQSKEKGPSAEQPTQPVPLPSQKPIMEEEKTPEPAKLDSSEVPKPSSPVYKDFHFNALMTSQVGLCPVYRIKDPTSKVKAICFSQKNSLLMAMDEREKILWQHPLPTVTQVFGGFDYNQDGWPDLGLLLFTPTQNTCGTHTMQETTIHILDGKTGTFVLGVNPMPDTCWTFPTTTYPTRYWYEASVLWGKGNTLAFLPYYATTGWFYTYNVWNRKFQTHAFYFPSIPDYQTTYLQAKQPIPNSHIANGLIHGHLLFFTSGRVVQYQVAPLSSTQLISDHPFQTDNRNDLAGRNYGLVAIDPNYQEHVVLISGTNTQSVYDDLLTEKMITDPWGAIERHITIYNIKTHDIQDRFFSSAHDDNNAYKYEKRVVYPSGVFVKTQPGHPSRIAYNVYAQGHWYLHISEPGSTADKYALKDMFLWDIRDLDNDGIDEWVVSLTRSSNEPDVPGYYFPKLQTGIYIWDETYLVLQQKKIYSEGVPALLPMFRTWDQSTTYGYLLPVLTLPHKGGVGLVLHQPKKGYQVVSYP